ncbi:MAG: electron transfer flavoprotein subunit alpha [Promethearchaeota archaeon]|nr:MAG: electron transfer flavoprotein subunit alpha [Candidatus Lokiarchaeota archaeon]
MGIKINQELCTGCESCLNACSQGGIKIINNKAQLTDACTICGACVEACPVGAIEIEMEEIAIGALDISQYRGVWIIGEQYNNKLDNVVYQLVGRGRELADKLSTNLTAVVLGSQLEDNIQDLSEFGVDEIIYIKSPILKNYYTEIFTIILADLIKEHKPEIVLIGATPIGRDFAPRLSKRLNTGLTADCTGLDIETETRNLLLQTRPTWGGRIMATIKTPNSRPQMATVRPGMFKVPEKMHREANIQIIEPDINANDIKTTIITTIPREKKQINLEDADVIVAGGRGVGSKDKFEILQELAKELNGEIAGSRVAVELGWIDAQRQIGQTGKSVSPKLYLACGISGAIQHRVGIQCSDIIVAINKDPNAPIFDMAHYGIVGDLHQVIPILIEEIKRIKAQEKLKKMS